MMNSVNYPASDLVEARTLWPGDRIVHKDHPAMITHVGGQRPGGKPVMLLDVVLEDESTSDTGQVKRCLSFPDNEKVPLLTRTEFMAVDMESDLTVWAVPINIIAMNRAFHYMERDRDPGFENLYESLKEDTFPLFEDDYEVKDWASNNMNWSDVKNVSKKISDSAKPDYHSDWIVFNAERLKKVDRAFVKR